VRRLALNVVVQHGQWISRPNGLSTVSTSCTRCSACSMCTANASVANNCSNSLTTSRKTAA